MNHKSIVRSSLRLYHKGMSSTCRRFLGVISLSALLVPLPALRAADKPNFLLILTDDQGWSQLSTAMHPEQAPEGKSDYLETPNMTRLAREGMRFTSGYSPAPLCTPTRRAILCGATAARSGSEFKSAWVPADHMTLPRALKQADSNYRCAHFGKWGEQMISTPEQCGYDVSDGETGNNTGGMPKSLGVASGSHDEGPPHFIDNKDPKRTRTVTDRAVAFMREQNKAGKPFYAQVSYYAQHLSVVCTEEGLRKYRDKGTPDRGYPPAWAAMMEDLDNGVGRLLAALDDLGIDKNTYVILTADNGGRGTVPGGDQKHAATNHPLTGAKHSLYEGGVRVPFIARGPGIAARSFCHTPVAGYDFLATFYDLAGGRAPLPETVDGVSLRPLFEDPAEARIGRPNDALIFHRPGKMFSAIRQGEHKLMVYWQLNGDVQKRELFQFDSHPREEGHDIADKDPATADRLQAILLAYLDSVNAEKPKAGAPKKKKGGNRKKK